MCHFTIGLCVSGLKVVDLDIDDGHFVMGLTDQSSLRVLGTSGIFLLLRQNKSQVEGRILELRELKHRFNAEKGFLQLLRCVSSPQKFIETPTFYFQSGTHPFVNLSHSLMTWFVELMT